MANPPETLKDLSTQVRDFYRAARSRAQQDLADALKTLNAVKAQQPVHARTLADTQSAIAGLRAQLAGTEVPADISALSAQIAALQVTERAQQAVLLEDADDAALAQAQADAATGFLATVAASLAAAEAAVGPAADDYDRRQQVRAAAVAPPLDTLQQDADDALASGVWTAASDRIDNEVPQEIRDEVDAAVAAENARRDAAANALADAVAIYTGELGSAGGPDGTIAALRIALAAADDALKAWVDQAKARYDRAIAAAVAVNDGPSLLTTAEEDTLTAMHDDGAAAAALRQAREEKRGEQVARQYDYDKAVEAFRAGNPDATAAAVAGDASVTPKAGPLKTANDDLTAAESDFDGAHQLAWGTWSGTIPEAAWRKIAAFREAEADLKDLHGTTAATLVQAARDAEKALAAALWGAAQHAVKAAWRQQEVALRTAIAARAAVARPARLLAAVRGDA